MEANYERPVQMLYYVDKQSIERKKSKARQTKGKKLPKFHSSVAVFLGDYFNYIQLWSMLHDKAND